MKAESAVIEELCRTEFMHRLIDMESTDYREAYRGKLADFMQQQTEFSARLHAVKYFLQANCGHNPDHVELCSCLNEAGHSQLKGRKLAFNILNRQLV